MIKENQTGDENVQDAAGQQDAAESSGGSSSETNPNANDFSSMRSSLKDMKGENSMLRNELLELRSAVSGMQQKPEEEPFAGRDESDYLTIAEKKASDKALRAEFKQGKEDIERKTQVSSFLSAHPDYKETMKEYGKQLPDGLRSFLAKYPNDPDVMIAAYEACKDGSARTRKNLSSEMGDNAKRAAENMNKPGAGSSAGSGGTISLAHKLKNMTPDERLAFSDECIRNC
jgi:hypothetical protein